MILKARQQRQSQVSQVFLLNRMAPERNCPHYRDGRCDMMFDAEGLCFHEKVMECRVQRCYLLVPRTSEEIIEMRKENPWVNERDCSGCNEPDDCYNCDTFLNRKT